MPCENSVHLATLVWEKIRFYYEVAKQEYCIENGHAGSSANNRVAESDHVKTSSFSNLIHLETSFQ